MKVLCTHITWDTEDVEGKPPRLPATMVMDYEGDDDDLADAMTEATGFCINSFCHRPLKKPVFGLMRQGLGRECTWWDGKGWVLNKHFAKVYTQLFAAERNCFKVHATKIKDLTCD